MGKLAIEEEVTGEKRVVTFSALLRERLGHHIHGERWATALKKVLKKHGLLKRPIHIISANMHSVMNSLFARNALIEEFPNNGNLEIYEALSSPVNIELRDKVIALANKNGMIGIDDASGTNIDVQIFDSAKFGKDACCYDFPEELPDDQKPVIFVMDYAFGEQAYETIDELFKPYKSNKKGAIFLNVAIDQYYGQSGNFARGQRGFDDTFGTYL